jgi:hypothetical protein
MNKDQLLASIHNVIQIEANDIMRGENGNGVMTPEMAGKALVAAEESIVNLVEEFAAECENSMRMLKRVLEESGETVD